ncbi:lytic polysaccharide monooxygenase [Cellulomonas sp. 179-A 4D5 NHS]|uniref:lytic polysaccharide monooxygenase n=1 Tax=Cellulomonas sp. 179-A 4D5 NHS TaxID=3142378 RepID=UPI0039A0A2EF
MTWRTRLRTLALAVPLTLVATTVVAAVPAAAHGSVTDPPSRNYRCWDVWGSRFQDPAMASQDPMCAQAWQADTTAMWNWNGLYREGVAGRHEQEIPDGQLCSGGRTGGDRYAALDTPGAWVAKTVPQRFTLTLTDQAKHGADYLRVYVTKPGFDPTRAAPAWSDMQLLQATGRYAPAGEYRTDVDLSGRSGRAILYTVWQASHSDQSYYLCSDISIGGPATTPTPTPTPTPTVTPTPTPTATPTPTPTATPTPTPTPTPGTGTCTAAVRVVGQWPGGWQGELTVTAGAAGTTGWRATVPGSAVTQAWNAAVSDGALTSASWNGALTPGASTTAGFLASGTPGTPTATCTGA